MTFPLPTWILPFWMTIGLVCFGAGVGTVCADALNQEKQNRTNEARIFIKINFPKIQKESRKNQTKGLLKLQLMRLRRKG
jgi:hypothetical protein